MNKKQEMQNEWKNSYNRGEPVFLSTRRNSTFY